MSMPLLKSHRLQFPLDVFATENFSLLNSAWFLTEHTEPEFS